MRFLSIQFNAFGGPKVPISIIVCNRVGIGVGPFWHLRPRWAFCGILREKDDGWGHRSRQLILRALWFSLGIRLGRSPL